MKKFSWVKAADFVIFLVLWVIVVFTAIIWLIAGVLVFPKFLDFHIATVPNATTGFASFFPAVLFVSYIGIIVTITFWLYTKLRKINPLSNILAKRKAKKELTKHGHEVTV